MNNIALYNQAPTGIGAVSADWPALDDAAANLGDYFRSTGPSCSSNALVQAFQVQYNNYITAGGGTSGWIRTDGFYDGPTQQALTAALTTSTTGKYSKGSADPSLPTAPQPASCNSAQVALAEAEGKLGGGTTGMVILAALGLVAVGGTAYLVMHHSKGSKHGRRSNPYYDDAGNLHDEYESWKPVKVYRRDPNTNKILNSKSSEAALIRGYKACYKNDDMAGTLYLGYLLHKLRNAHYFKS